MPVRHLPPLILLVFTLAGPAFGGEPAAEPAATPDPGRLAEIERNLEAGNSLAAATLARELYRQCPADNVRGLLLRSLLVQAEGDSTGARGWAADVLELDPENETAREIMARTEEAPPPWDAAEGYPVRASPRSWEAINLGLRWLARNQEEDGHWDSARHGGRAGEYADVALTGLALLAFQSDLRFIDYGYYRHHVQRALDWLEERQGADGSFSANNYAQGMCALAVTENYGLSGERRDLAERAVLAVCERQRPDGGWDYGDRGEAGRGRGDVSLTAWQILTLKSAWLADVGRDRAPETLERARVFLESVGAAKGTGPIAYSPGGGRPEGGGEAVPGMAWLSLHFLGAGREEEAIVRGRETLADEGPIPDNIYQMYFASLFMMLACDLDRWSEWNFRMRDPLAGRQVRAAGEEMGSWDPAAFRHGAAGGRVYTTAMAVNCLNVYYHGYIPIYED